MDAETPSNSLDTISKFSEADVIVTSLLYRIDPLFEIKLEIIKLKKKHKKEQLEKYAPIEYQEFINKMSLADKEYNLDKAIEMYHKAQKQLYAAGSCLNKRLEEEKKVKTARQDYDKVMEIIDKELCDKYMGKELKEMSFCVDKAEKISSDPEKFKAQEEIWRSLVKMVEEVDLQLIKMISAKNFYEEMYAGYKDEFNSFKKFAPEQWATFQIETNKIGLAKSAEDVIDAYEISKSALDKCRDVSDKKRKQRKVINLEENKLNEN